MADQSINRRNILKSSLAAATAVGAAVPLVSHAQATVTWRMQALWDGGTTPQKFEERFVARVAELTGGRFKINLFAAGQIVPAAQAFDAVRGGAFELMKTFDGYEAGKIPSFAFTSTIPFGFPESDQYEAWFYERGGLDMARQAYAPAGLHYIAPTVYGQEPLHSKVPIRKMADLAGKKGRFVGLASAVMGAMGVAVTPLPTGEVYTALDKGVIDMADRGDLTANFEAGLAEVAKYVIVPGFHQPTTAASYVANRGAYDKLPAEFKAALAVSAREVSASLRQHILVNDATVLAKYQAKGCEIIHFNAADIAAARPKAMASWRAATKGDALASKILDSQVAFMKELGLLA
ncbi:MULTISPECIES: TRAP transporter substrate-binding protein DctP [unclassified Simplicispira]|jgi:TRAP-type mannitol/chloroaromatic compound transport system substrate-binding protein|uniref:TRAP transporter substrate-binding protein DctP n=1 Tax=unclassified Simplicispira TaxID=2630407 RepID=UPI000927A27A|nr:MULTISPECIES: TRAP transporter substrate-binding protein DctP [unclassified Simplicispira]MBH1978156.1 TRAP transporter substrate-binding protein DctP [Comamonadaceae bacterium]OJX35877.1 MAG: C4-dicarboxylate ABC transporter substrate-binding protein [Burkholderiales bacterium 68-12]TXH30342.1 MAG: C4-dicarboxylate ABC transporter substrate-binding protein [Burkholderiaceae bacterium]PVY54977.1 TRAP-type mannitol/chloroaromatic compound transport system substrate-binding protein [Simplicisp